MTISFVASSCNYNITLSKEDLHILNTEGLLMIDPERISSRFVDEYGDSVGNIWHTIRYFNQFNDKPIQFLAIQVDNKEEKQNEREYNEWDDRGDHYGIWGID